MKPKPANGIKEALTSPQSTLLLCVSSWLRRQECRNSVVLMTWLRDVNLALGRYRGEDDVTEPLQKSQLRRMNIFDERSEHSADMNHESNTRLQWPRAAAARATECETND